MKDYWTKLAGRIDGLSLRERILVLLMAVAVVAAMVDTVLIDPLRKQQAGLAQQMKLEQDKTAAIHSQIESLVKQGGNDPDRANRERLAVLGQEIAKADEALRGMQKGLVAPERMAALLGDILARDSRLQLVSLKSQPPTSLLDIGQPKPEAKATEAAGKSAEAQADIPLVYRHGVELVVRGSYADLLAYVGRLEGLSWHMLWGGLEFKVEEYPRNSLSLTLYTLSLDKNWLAL